MGNFFSSNNTSNTTNTTNPIKITDMNCISKYDKPMIKKTEIIKGDVKIQNNNLKYKITIDIEIKFINSFNDMLDVEYFNLFKKYDKIIFGFSFNKCVKNKFPTNIKFIQFGHNFNQPIDNLIFEEHNINNQINNQVNNQVYKLEELIFGDCFNQKVDNLTQGLKKITFGYNFNQDVSNLPTTIEYIKFNNNFNQNVDYLPSSVIYIIFGDGFNQSIDNLPSSLEEITLGNEDSNNYNLKINFLPPKLKKLELNKNYYENNILHIQKIISNNKFITIHHK